MTPVRITPKVVLEDVTPVRITPKAILEEVIPVRLVTPVRLAKEYRLSSKERVVLRILNNYLNLSISD